MPDKPISKTKAARIRTHLRYGNSFQNICALENVTREQVLHVQDLMVLVHVKESTAKRHDVPEDRVQVVHRGNDHYEAFIHAPAEPQMVSITLTLGAPKPQKRTFAELTDLEVQILKVCKKHALPPHLISGRCQKVKRDIIPVLDALAHEGWLIKSELGDPLYQAAQ